ncbi:MAG: DAK2 domain-containing protein [Ruminococcaceae bacterium]|nr:DAK2 domain-containing protein [Oscillospiraceae bacterium]
MKIDGKTFSQMCVSGANALDNNQATINALNVFPVPDGDTGINMSLTMSSVLDLDNFTGTISDCAMQISNNILRSARGNSGAILSLFFRGFAKSLKGLESADAEDFAKAFECGTREAYSAVMNPTEGTILTVMRMCAEEALKVVREKRFEGDTIGLFAYLLSVANKALAETPEMLPLLKEAGVVDAGGSGFVTLISGMLAALNNHPILRERMDSDKKAAADFADFDTADIKFGYCTECIVDKDEQHVGEGTGAELRPWLAEMGNSLVFIDDETFIKFHVHTNHPGEVIEKALSYGPLSMVKIENMRNQHTSLVQNEEAPAKETVKPEAPKKPYGFVSVAVGEGVCSLFRDLGVDYIVPGGQTMNPSTEDVLNAIAAVNAETVFILPNNKNIFMVSDRAAELTTDKKVIVIPSAHFTQGFSAMMAFDENVTPEENAETMKEMLSTVTTFSLTHAVRDAEIDGLHIKDGQVLGLVNGKVKVTTASDFEAVKELLSFVEEPSFLSLYTGADAKAEETARIEALLRESYPAAEMVVAEGGQPLYDYVISAE